MEALCAEVAARVRDQATRATWGEQEVQQVLLGVSKLRVKNEGLW